MAVNLTATDEVNLLKGVIRFKPGYLEPHASKGFEDVVLVSREGDRYPINACIFASLSHVTRRIIRDVIDDDVTVLTDLSRHQLYKIHVFATTGAIHGYQGVDELLCDQALISTFSAFGVDLFRLRFGYEEGVPWWKGMVLQTKPEPLDEEVKEEEDIKATSCDDTTDYYLMPELGVDWAAEDDDFVAKNKPPKKPSKRKAKRPLEAEWDEEGAKKPSKRKVSKMPSTAGPEKGEEGHGRWGRTGNRVPGMSLRDSLFHFPQDEGLRDSSYEYQCTLCVRGFAVPRMFKQHVRRHGARSEDDCYFCLYCTDYVAFPTAQQANAHQAREHDTESYACPYCPKTFKKGYKWHLNEHIQAQHAHKCVICASCGTELSKKVSLKHHQERHGKYHDSKCRICPDFEASTWADNVKHYDTVHNGEVQYKCGLCPAWFMTNLQRLHHASTECTASKTTTMQAEQKQEKTKEMCPYCGVSYSRSYMQDHINYNHGTHAIPCEEPGCNYVIKHPDAIKRHMRLHEKFQCEECGYTNTKKMLSRHKKSVHTQNHLKPFVCKVCNKGFADKQHWADHNNVHTGAKPYKCPHCDMGFASGGTRAGHVRSVHLGKKRK